jgi:hypothetical protein
MGAVKRQQREWRDPRDGQLWIVARAEERGTVRILFSAPGESGATYSIPTDTRLSLTRTSDGRLAELLDQARAAPDRP